MPCDSIRTNSVDLSSIGRIDLKLLAAALNALGLGAAVQTDGTIQGRNVYYGGGQLTLSGYTATQIKLDQVKQAYSAEVVKSTAKRFGWTLKQVEPFKYQVIKR